MIAPMSVTALPMNASILASSMFWVVLISDPLPGSCSLLDTLPPRRHRFHVIRHTQSVPSSQSAATWPSDDLAIGFLGLLDPGQSRSLEEVAVRRRFRKGQALFHQHGSSDRVVVLLSGRVKVSKLTDDGKEIVLA